MWGLLLFVVGFVVFLCVVVDCRCVCLLFVVRFFLLLLLVVRCGSLFAVFFCFIIRRSSFLMSVLCVVVFLWLVLLFVQPGPCDPYPPPKATATARNLNA